MSTVTNPKGFLFTTRYSIRKGGKNRPDEEQERLVTAVIPSVCPTK